MKYEDAGCDEGPGYWGRAGGSLFDYLDLLYLATDGKINIYNEPLVRKIGQFIYKAWIHDDYYINFADGRLLPVWGDRLTRLALVISAIASVDFLPLQ